MRKPGSEQMALDLDVTVELVGSCAWEGECSQLDALLEESRLYRSGSDYKKLLDFAVRLNNPAPFNAILLQIQKPGVIYAASSAEWKSWAARSTLVPDLC